MRLQAVFKNFFRQENGNSMVEFGLVTAFVFLPLLFGVIEFGRLTWSKDMIVAAAREGVRWAAVRGTQNQLAGGTLATATNVSDSIKARTKLSPITVAAVWAQDKDPGDTVTVTVTYVYTPVVKIPFLTTSKTITAKSRQIVVY
jgi:Flp pilus assembly protein TadG